MFAFFCLNNEMSKGITKKDKNLKLIFINNIFVAIFYNLKFWTDFHEKTNMLETFQILHSRENKIFLFV